MRIGIVAHRPSETNLGLVRARWPSLDPVLITPSEALLQLGAGDVALARLDVRRTLDGIEDGLMTLSVLQAEGIRVLNPPGALLTAHDKLLTARALRSAGLPHPRTAVLCPGQPPQLHSFPLVVKPRFGSWAAEVALCHTPADLRRRLDSLAGTPWFRTHGALVQELVPPLGYDVRLIVAGGVVVGAIERVARPGEWRTNVSLGATRVRCSPPAGARELALAAAGAVGGHLVGVDLLPLKNGGYTVLEVNGAADFGPAYSPRGDVFDRVAHELDRLAGSHADANARECAVIPFPDRDASRRVATVAETSTA